MTRLDYEAKRPRRRGFHDPGFPRWLRVGLGAVAMIATYGLALFAGGTLVLDDRSETFTGSVRFDAALLSFSAAAIAILLAVLGLVDLRRGDQWTLMFAMLSMLPLALIAWMWWSLPGP